MPCVVRICALPRFILYKAECKNVLFMLEPLSPPTAAKQKSKSFPDLLRVYPKRKRRQHERIFRQFKEGNRRFSGAKSRFSDTEMTEKPP